MTWVESIVSTIMRNSQSTCNFLGKCTSQDQADQYPWNSVPWIKLEFVYKMEIRILDVILEMQEAAQM